MKVLGLIGGISWVSTIDYYRYINEGINQRMGASNYAECVIYSFNYQDVIDRNSNKDFKGTLNMLLQACEHLRSAGAKGIVMCANTMHMFADDIENETDLPIIHIATETAKAIHDKQLKKVGLLGTNFTMEMNFFKNKLREYNIEAVIPAEDDRHFIHTTIFDELGKGVLKEETKQRYLAIIKGLETQGAEGVILGCTEIPMLIKQEDVSMPVFDTTRIHAAAAVNFALNK